MKQNVHAWSLSRSDILQRSSLNLTFSSHTWVVSLLTHLRVSVQILNEIGNSVYIFVDILETSVRCEYCCSLILPEVIEKGHDIHSSLHHRVVILHRLSSGGHIDSRTGLPSFCSGPTSRTSSRESFTGRTGDCGSDHGSLGLTTVSRLHGSAQFPGGPKEVLTQTSS